MGLTVNSATFGISVKQNTLPLYVKYTDFPHNTTIHFIATQLHVLIQ